MLDLKPEELEELIQEVERSSLPPKYREIIKALVNTILFLRQALADKKQSIKRLLKMIFGKSSEKKKDVLKKEEKSNESGSADQHTTNPEAAGDGTEEGSESESKPEEKGAGHGRNGAADLSGAERIPVPCKGLTLGCSCPECKKGKLYKLKDPGPLIRFSGISPLQAKIWDLEKWRCNLCGKVFKAEAPPEAGHEKYDASCIAMIGLLKYGSGMPFYRIEKLQASLGIPLPASTQWELVESAALGLYVVYEELIVVAAQGEIVHNDDTVMKILDLLKELARQEGEEKPERTGIFTSGVVAIVKTYKIALFHTGLSHAGEFLATILKERPADLEPPIQMADALSRNAPGDFKVILGNCLAHARRKYVEVVESFPEECRFVLETLEVVYKNDDLAKEKNLSAPERLKRHQEKSGPLMDGLKKWFTEQIEGKKVEPHSGLGKAIAYMRNHWEPLTLFLRQPGAPIDNNICEQILKMAILNRKNSLFYRSERGAIVGDFFMSLIHTCNLNGVNPFDYLRALIEHADKVFENPREWLPWNYHAALERLGQPRKATG
jgi:rubredoxin